MQHYLSDTVYLYKPKNDVFYYRNEDTAKNKRFFDDLSKTLYGDGNKVWLLDREYLPSIWLRDYFPILVDDHYYFFTPCYDYMSPSERSTYESVNFKKSIRQLLGKKHIKEKRLLIDGGNIVFNNEYVITSEKVFIDNRTYSRSEIEKRLRRIFNGRKVIFLQTDSHDKTGHVDGLIQFLHNDLLLINNYSEIDKDLHKNNMKEIDKIAEVVTIPHYVTDKKSSDGWYDLEGNYINFISTSKSIVLSTFGHKDLEDEVKSIIQEYDIFNRNIHFINSDVVNKYGGGLHCISWDTKEKEKKSDQKAA